MWVFRFGEDCSRLSGLVATEQKAMHQWEASHVYVPSAQASWPSWALPSSACDPWTPSETGCNASAVQIEPTPQSLSTEHDVSDYAINDTAQQPVLVDLEGSHAILDGASTPLPHIEPTRRSLSTEHHIGDNATNDTAQHTALIDIEHGDAVTYAFTNIHMNHNEDAATTVTDRVEPELTRLRPFIFVYDMDPMYTQRQLQYRTDLSQCLHRFVTTVATISTDLAFENMLHVCSTLWSKKTFLNILWINNFRGDGYNISDCSLDTTWTGNVSYATQTFQISRKLRYVQVASLSTLATMRLLHTQQNDEM